MTRAERLLLDERILADGQLVRCWASRDGDGARVHIAEDGGASGALSVAVLDRVMCRYGRALDEAVTLDGFEALELGDGCRLRRLRYHAAVDATGRDYLVWERPGEPPLAVIATHATAALRYLLDAAVRTEPPRSEVAK